MSKEIKKLPVDAETHKLLNYDSLYYVPHSPYDEYEFLKKLSIKKFISNNKEVR